MLTSNRRHNSGLCGFLHARVLQRPKGVQQVSEGPPEVHGAAPAPSPRRRGAAGYQGVPPGMPRLRPSLSCAAPSGRRPNTEQDSPAIDPCLLTGRAAFSRMQVLVRRFEVHGAVSRRMNTWHPRGETSPLGTPGVPVSVGAPTTGGQEDRARRPRPLLKIRALQDF